MMNFAAYRDQWTGNIRRDLLSGLVVALALIPEAIAFSIIAGVDPKVGLYASFSIAVVTAIVGERPGMISAATAATAVLMVTLVKEHGLQYLLAATVLAGVLQIGAGTLRLGHLMRFVSRSVMTGFVNALAILIFLAQLPELIGVAWITYLFVGAGLAIIYILPRFTRVVPSPLICIIVLTAIVMIFDVDGIRRVGDMGELPGFLACLPDPPNPSEFRNPPDHLSVLGRCGGCWIAGKPHDPVPGRRPHRHAVGQEPGMHRSGAANVATGFIGGMAGCAMIGQSMINVKSGGRGRLSCFAAGALLLFMIVVLGPWVEQIPMAALVAIMMVSIGTFSWSSIRNLRPAIRGLRALS